MHETASRSYIDHLTVLTHQPRYQGHQEREIDAGCDLDRPDSRHSSNDTFQDQAFEMVSTIVRRKREEEKVGGHRDRFHIWHDGYQ